MHVDAARLEFQNLLKHETVRPARELVDDITDSHRRPQLRDGPVGGASWHSRRKFFEIDRLEVPARCRLVHAVWYRTGTAKRFCCRRAHSKGLGTRLLDVWFHEFKPHIQ